MRNAQFHIPGGGCSDATDPSWAEVAKELRRTLSLCGTISLNVVDAGESGPVALEVYSDGGRFLVMLGEHANGDYDVRTLYDGDRGQGMVSIVGNEWDNRIVTSDRALVEAVFHEFFHTGNVSTDVLD